MSRWSVLTLVLCMITLTGCGSDVAPPEQGAKEEPEGAAEPTTAPTTTGEASGASSEAGTMSTAEADAEKAAAAEHEMTIADFRKMDDDSLALLACQLDKYVQDHGEKATEERFMEGIEGAVGAKNRAEVTPFQETLIEEGYSCTFQEMNLHRSAGSASTSATASAGASAGAYEEAEVGDTFELGSYSIAIHDVHVSKDYGAYSLDFETTITNKGQRVADTSMDIQVSLSNPAGKSWDQDISYDPPNLRTIPPGRKAAGEISFYFDKSKPSGTYYLDITDFTTTKMVTVTARV